MFIGNNISTGQSEAHKELEAELESLFGDMDDISLERPDDEADIKIDDEENNNVIDSGDVMLYDEGAELESMDVLDNNSDTIEAANNLSENDNQFEDISIVEDNVAEEPSDNSVIESGEDMVAVENTEVIEVETNDNNDNALLEQEMDNVIDEIIDSNIVTDDITVSEIDVQPEDIDFEEQQSDNIDGSALENNEAIDAPQFNEDANIDTDTNDYIATGIDNEAEAPDTLSECIDRADAYYEENLAPYIDSYDNIDISDLDDYETAGVDIGNNANNDFDAGVSDDIDTDMSNDNLSDIDNSIENFNDIENESFDDIDADAFE